MDDELEAQARAFADQTSELLNSTITKVVGSVAPGRVRIP